MNPQWLVTSDQAGSPSVTGNKESQSTQKTLWPWEWIHWTWGEDRVWSKLIWVSKAPESQCSRSLFQEAVSSNPILSRLPIYLTSLQKAKTPVTAWPNPISRGCPPCTFPHLVQASGLPSAPAIPPDLHHPPQHTNCWTKILWYSFDLSK